MICPIKKFKLCWEEAKSHSKLKYPSAMCVSTMDQHGFPSGRFVDLKSVEDNGFIFCTNLDSEKVRDIQHHSKVALTFWWEAIGYQVRVRGHASEIPRSTAEKYWQTRSREAQITTLICQQSQPLLPDQNLSRQLEEAKQNLADKPILMPENWGGFIVKPILIEFLTFKENRLHTRERYTSHDDVWVKERLQP